MCYAQAGSGVISFLERRYLAQPKAYLVAEADKLRQILHRAPYCVGLEEALLWWICEEFTKNSEHRVGHLQRDQSGPHPRYANGLMAQRVRNLFVGTPKLLLQ